MRRLAVWSVVFGASAAWAACSSFDESDPDGANATGDAGNDALTADAAQADADAGPFVCTAMFCDGFERDGSVVNGWNDSTPPSAAAFTLADLHPRTGARSLQLELRASTTENRRLTLVKWLPATATRASLDFWLYYDKPPSMDTTVANVTLRGNLGGNIFIVLTKGGWFAFGEQAAPDAGLTLAQARNVGSVGTGGSYRHVKLEIANDLVDGGNGSRLTIDGESGDIALANSNGPLHAYIGSSYSPAGQTASDFLYYDDVVIEATPR